MKHAHLHNLKGGPTPSGLISGGFRSLSEFRAMTPLPDNAQREFDRVVVEVGMDRLAVVRRLLERGLTYDLPNWLAVPELYWERKSREGHAQRTMTPGARNERQQHDRSGKTYPIYATIDGWSFHQRQILTAERSGINLETDGADAATRNCNEAVEDAAINGGPQVAGNASPGLLNAPNAATLAYAGGEAWDAAGKTGAEILTDLIGMANKLKANKYYGPYELLIPTDYENKLNEDYSTNYPRTIRQRLEELEFGGQNLVITVADLLPDDRTILFQATRNVVDVVVGQEPTFVSWQGASPWDIEMAVLACMIVRVKDDYDGKSGICTGNTS